MNKINRLNNSSEQVVASLIRRSVGLYKILLSPFLGNQCRFYPTCSEFASQSLQDLPLRRALPEIGKRLASCHPFHQGGFYPVPRS